jgi:CRISPR/Cas system endoribonuclease Cas6 (RAMP superfamily)
MTGSVLKKQYENLCFSQMRCDLHKVGMSVAKRTNIGVPENQFLCQNLQSESGVK